METRRYRGRDLDHAEPKSGRDLTKGNILSNVLYMGVPSMFERAGFVTCARPSKRKRIVRYET